MVNDDRVTLNALRCSLPVGSRAAYVAVDKEQEKYYVISTQPTQMPYKLYVANADLHLQEVPIVAHQMDYSGTRFEFDEPTHQASGRTQKRTLYFSPAEREPTKLIEYSGFTSLLERIL